MCIGGSPRSVVDGEKAEGRKGSAEYPRYLGESVKCMPVARLVQREVTIWFLGCRKCAAILRYG